jgi:hypothetical protein
MKQNLLTYILTLIIVFLCALNTKAKDFKSTMNKLLNIN